MTASRSTLRCGPCTLVKHHFSVPIEWLKLHELTDEYAIFKVWPTEQDRIAATHLIADGDARLEVGEGG